MLGSPSGARVSPRHWLMKTEPTTYSIDDLIRDGSTPWEGVRNAQARNFMRDDMKVGDHVIFYHSSASPPGAVGLARICRAAYPDSFAFDQTSAYFDPSSDPEAPKWMMVDVEFVEKWSDIVSLGELKAERSLENMLVVRRGQRLSVQPVEAEHFKHVVDMGRGKGPCQTR